MADAAAAHRLGDGGVAIGGVRDVRPAARREDRSRSPGGPYRARGCRTARSCAGGARSPACRAERRVPPLRCGMALPAAPPARSTAAAARPPPLPAAFSRPSARHRDARVPRAGIVQARSSHGSVIRSFQYVLRINRISIPITNSQSARARRCRSARVGRERAAHPRVCESFACSGWTAISARITALSGASARPWARASAVQRSSTSRVASRGWPIAIA